jgi:phosphonate transport system permease protein
LLALTVPWTTRRILLAASGLGLAAAAAASWWDLGMNLTSFVAGLGDVRNLLARMLPPRLPNPGRVVSLALETFLIALLGTVLATAVSIPLGAVAARNISPNRLLTTAARGLISVCRAVPDLVFAAIFVRAIGIGILPGVMAIALHSIGMVGKLFADSIENLDESPRLATEAVGATRLQAFVTGVCPQVLPSLLGTFLYRLDINLRTSVVLGFVGAGGIGFALRDAFGGLLYPQALGIVIVIVLMIALFEFVSGRIRSSLLGEAAAGLPAHGWTGLGRLGSAARRIPNPPPCHPVTEPQTAGGSLRPPWTHRRLTGAFYLVLFLGLVVYSLGALDISFLELIRAVPEIWVVAGRLFPPEFGNGLGPQIFSAMVETIAIGFVATVIGATMAVPIALLAARNVAPARWIYAAARYGLVIWRGIPELILAVIFVSAIGLGPMAGALALSIYSVGFLAKLVSDSLEEVRPGPREAVMATGATRGQEVVSSLLPQALPAIAGHLLYVLDINIRSSTILGLVGGGGIGFLLFNSLRVLQWEVTGAILILIFVTVYSIERFSGWLRTQLI